MSNAQLGMLFFLFSEAVFFIFLLIAYINFHLGPAKESLTHALDVQKTAIFTAILILSSLTAWRAHRNAIGRKFLRFHIWLAITIGLGSVFL